MNRGRTVFSQLMDFVPIKTFRRCVQRYPGRFRIRRFSHWDQFLAIPYGE